MEPNETKQEVETEKREGGGGALLQQMLEDKRPESHSYEPRDLSEAKEMAKILSTSGLLPDSLRAKPADVLTVMAQGKELGLTTMQSLCGIDIIKGRPRVSAALTVGMILSRREVCEYFDLVSSTATEAVYEAKRVGRPPVRLPYTIEMAKRAELVGKDNWRHYPEAMLRARAAIALARVVFPDLCAGIYDPDEIQPDRPASTVLTVPSSVPRGELLDVVKASVEKQSQDPKIKITEVDG